MIGQDRGDRIGGDENERRVFIWVYVVRIRWVGGEIKVVLFGHFVCEGK